jgi:preprotein translocase subunit SecG
MKRSYLLLSALFFICAFTIVFISKNKIEQKSETPVHSSRIIKRVLPKPRRLLPKR